MVSFLKRSALFGLGLLILNGILFGIVDPIYSQKEYRRHFFRRIDDMSKRSLETIVLSDSHGIPLDDDQLMTAGIANFSIGSDSYSDMLLELKFILDHQNVHCVVLSTDYHLFTQYRDKTNNERYSTTLDDIIPYRSFVNRFVPLLSPYSRDLLFRIIIGKEAYRSHRPPKLWHEMTEVQRMKSIRKRIQNQFPTEIISKTQLGSFDELILLGKEKGIPIVGIKYPLAGTYQAAMKQTGFDFNSVDRHLEKTGVVVFDYLDHFSREDNSDSFFEDQDHVNRKGSVVLTSSLLTDLSKFRREIQ